jgi:hypothetical protein
MYGTGGYIRTAQQHAVRVSEDTTGKVLGPDVCAQAGRGSLWGAALSNGKVCETSAAVLSVPNPVQQHLVKF